jgi:hypothetical protein
MVGSRRNPPLDLRQPEPRWWQALTDAQQLVYGSDRPVNEPQATRRAAALRANGAGLLASVGGVA